MGVSRHRQQARQGTPKLAAGCDPTRLLLTPEEGFLLSRIDGYTPWPLLREIGGLPPERVDDCIERWVGEGVVEICTPGEPAPEPPPERPPEPPRQTAPEAPEDGIDPSLEISLDAQRRVIEFEKMLDRPYHELLGITRDADVKEVKRAYFKLSRVFHPDLYFRKNVGAYASRLERIFRKLLEAHEMLSDPMARAEMERSLAESPEAASEPPPAEPPPEPQPEMPKRLGPDQIRRRLARISAHGRALAARKQKAKRYFETGMDAFRRERWLEAAASVRLAIAFDPGNEAYRDSFGEVQQRAHAERAKQLVREAEGSLDVRDYGRALAAFEEALQYRPHDAELHHRAARVAWLSGQDLRKAKELAQLACELLPDNASFRCTLGQIYQAAGLEANARRELRRARELDPTDEEAKALLASLGRG